MAAADASPHTDAMPPLQAPTKTAYLAYLKGIDRGGQVNLLRLLARLDRAKHESLAVLPGHGPLADALHRLGVRTVPGKLPSGTPRHALLQPHRWLNYLRVRRVLGDFRPHVIYVDGISRLPMAAHLARLVGAKVVWHAQTSMHNDTDRERICLADQVVAVAPHVHALIKRICPTVPVECIPNAVDTDLFCPGSEVALRDELGVTPTHPVLLYVGGLHESKGVGDLIEAFARLLEAIPSARLWLVGKGSDEQALRARAARLGIGDRARFVGPRSDVVRFYRAADVFVLASHSEGLPLTVLEAMATGTACVGTSIPGIVELLDDGCGIVAPVRDPVALAGTLRSVVEAPEWRREMVARAKQKVLAGYGIDSYVAGFDAVLRRCHCSTSR